MIYQQCLLCVLLPLTGSMPGPTADDKAEKIRTDIFVKIFRSAFSVTSQQHEQYLAAVLNYCTHEARSSLSLSLSFSLSLASPDAHGLTRSPLSSLLPLLSALLFRLLSYSPNISLSPLQFLLAGLRAQLDCLDSNVFYSKQNYEADVCPPPPSYLPSPLVLLSVLQDASFVDEWRIRERTRLEALIAQLLQEHPHLATITKEVSLSCLVKRD